MKRRQVKDQRVKLTHAERCVGSHDLMVHRAPCLELRRSLLPGLSSCAPLGCEIKGWPLKQEISQVRAVG